MAASRSSSHLPVRPSPVPSARGSLRAMPPDVELDTKLYPGAADLDRVNLYLALLAELNDPCASARALAAIIEQLPTMHIRVRARYLQRFPDRGQSALGEQITRLGNRELERLLLDMLEEMTILRYELADAKAGR